MKSYHLQKMDGPKGHYATGHKSDREKQILYNLSYMYKNNKKRKFIARWDKMMAGWGSWWEKWVNSSYICRYMALTNLGSFQLLFLQIFSSDHLSSFSFWNTMLDFQFLLFHKLCGTCSLHLLFNLSLCSDWIIFIIYRQVHWFFFFCHFHYTIEVFVFVLYFSVLKGPCSSPKDIIRKCKHVPFLG